MQPSTSPLKDQFIVSHNSDKGIQLCLVREDPSCQPTLLFWNGSSPRVASSFELEGELYKPLPIAAAVLTNLRLPPLPIPYHSVDKLVNGIATAFMQRGHVEDGQARLLAYSCIASWFPEAWPLAPCVSITGPIGPDRVLILKLLSCFCRHSVLLGQACAESLLRIAAGLEPTLLINYSEVPRKVQGILNAGCYRGLSIPRACGGIADLFGMKVVAASQPAMWLENSLNLAIPPRENGPTACWDKGVLEPLAAEFQPMLLMYRLEHLREVAASDWDVHEFVSPVREIARSLGICLCSANLREDLLGLLHAQEEETRTAWSRDTRAIVIEACLLASHEPAKARLYVGEVAEIANEILKMRNEQLSLLARGVGSILTQIGLSAERLDKAGYGLRLNERTRGKIHALAKSYGVRSTSQAFAGCPHCKGLAGRAAG